jgi:hypothetical protein
VIPKDKLYRFRIKITNTKKSLIILGIVDRLLGKKNEYSHGENYGIYYDCYNGYVYPKFGCIGTAIKSGETAEVEVDLSKGKVEFRVSGIIKAAVNNNKMLTEGNR